MTRWASPRGSTGAAPKRVYVGILGAAVWAIGSGLLARDVEGDDADHADLAAERGTAH